MKLFCWKVLGVEHIGKQGFARGIDTKKKRNKTNSNSNGFEISHLVNIRKSIP